MEPLVRPVILVAGAKISEQMRADVLERVNAERGEHPMPSPEGQG